MSSDAEMTGGTATERQAVVYLLRHGRTQLNAGGYLRGRIDVPLDEVGQAEAEALAEVFSSVQLGAVVASPLSRASDTAAAVARRHRLAVEVDADLADRDWGEWAGRSEAEAIARFGSLESLPGAEGAAEFRRRVLAALERLGDRAERAPVLAVAHDAVNRSAIAGLVAGQGPPAGIGQRTGCWNQLVRRGLEWRALVIDAVPGDGHIPGQGGA